MIKASTLFLTVAALAACGDDGGTVPVQYSQPVGINLKVKSSDVVNGTISIEKGINTESSNPYGAFITAARNELGGVDPGHIELTAGTLILGGNSTGVVGLGEIFVGQVEVVFQMNETNNTFPAATRTMLATDGSGPLDLTPSFTSAGAADADYTKILGGSFKVVLRGPAHANFRGAGADADVQTTLTFTAYELEAP